MNCRNCGAELHEEQKVCIKCGARTAAGGGFYVEEEQPWRPPRSLLIAAGVAVILVIVTLVLNSMRTMPPDLVAREWFDAMCQRQMNSARQYQSPNFEHSLGADSTALMALAEGCYAAVNLDDAKVSMAVRSLEPTSDPRHAIIDITLTSPQGRSDFISLIMLRDGGRWLVDRIETSTL